MYWFTSDTHFNHANIIEYTKRPFKSIEHMDREIIRRWNERVGPHDTVIHLGDFMFGGSVVSGTKRKPEYYLDQLNGRMVHVRGNHDGKSGLDSRIDSIAVMLGGVGWWCQHKPENLTWSYNLCGHVHNNWEILTTSRYVVVNVSVDVWDYYPVRIEDILERVPDIRNPNT